MHQIHTRTSPSTTVRVHVEEQDGAVLYVVQVPPGRTVHSTTEGVYEVRLGDECVPLEGEQLRGLRTLREEYDWSAEASDLGVSALSPAALERAAGRLRDLGADEIADLAETDVEAFARPPV